MHPAEIDYEHYNCDSQNFDDEKVWPVFGDPDGTQQYVLYVGVETEKPSVPLVIERLPGKPNVGKYCRPSQPCDERASARFHLSRGDASV